MTLQKRHLVVLVIQSVVHVVKKVIMLKYELKMALVLGVVIKIVELTLLLNAVVLRVIWDVIGQHLVVMEILLYIQMHLYQYMLV